MGHRIDDYGHHIDVYGRHTGGVGLYGNGLYDYGYNSRSLYSPFVHHLFTFVLLRSFDQRATANDLSPRHRGPEQCESKPFLRGSVFRQRGASCGTSLSSTLKSTYRLLLQLSPKTC